MAAAFTLFIIGGLILLIYVLVEVKRMRHKIFSIFLIGLILFSYFSASLIFVDQDIDFKTIPGVITATKIYFSWLGGVFGNLKQITAQAIGMDWGTNKTTDDSPGLFDFGKK